MQIDRILLSRTMNKTMFELQFIKDWLQSLLFCHDNISKAKDMISKRLASEFDGCCSWLRGYFSQNEIAEHVKWFNERFSFDITLDEVCSGEPFHSSKLSTIL